MDAAEILAICYQSQIVIHEVFLNLSQGVALTHLYFVCNGKVFFFLFLLFHVYGYFACIYVYVSHAYLVSMDTRRVSDPLELELQAVVNHHVGAGN